MSDEKSPLGWRLVTHAFNDLCRATEDGNFAVETPRVYADTDTFERVDIQCGREPKQVALNDGLAEMCVGPPYLELDLEWFGDGHEAEALFSDLHAHSQLEAEVVLHGSMHLWRVDWCEASMESGYSPVTETNDYSVTLHWAEVEDAGWQ